MNRTKIESVRNPDGTPGYSWNPITGCLYHNNGMCKGGNFPCWAYKLAYGRLKTIYLANRNIAPVGTMIIGAAMGENALRTPFHPRYWPDRLAELDVLPGPDTEPRGKGIFVCDMSDLFGIDVPEQWTEEVLDVIALPANEHHRFYLLTKQPQNLVKFSPFPDNCWVGATVARDSYFDDALCGLLNIQAKKRYLCFEPLLGRIKVTPMSLVGIDQLIIGAQTKPTVMPKIEWVKELVDAADLAGAKVFLKDNLGWPRLTAEGSRPFYKKNGGTWELRQELPDGR